MDKTFISLFGGVGGFDLAFQRQGWRGVWYNDIDKYAVKTYNKNFGTNYEPTDITTINPNTIPEHSLICAGFPCQSFSIAGKRGGFADTRGTMFFEIMRIAKHQRTPYLLLENVKGLLSHDNGWTFATILNTLDELGYDAEWQVLNSKFFGVPQNRERVFIIANLRTNPRPEVFPLTKNAGEILEISGREKEEGMISVFKETAFDTGHRDFRESHSVPTLSSQMGTGGNNVPMVLQKHHNDEVREYSDIVPTLSKDMGDNFPVVISHSPRSGNPKLGGTGVLVSEEHAFTLDSTPHIVAQRGRESGQMFEPNSESNSLTNVAKDNYVFQNKLRRLTPTECARLQGFPDDWHVGVSDTQAYKQYGNSVTVNVVEEIAKRLNMVIFK